MKEKLKLLSKNKKAIIITLVAIVVMVSLLLAFFIVKGKKKTVKMENNTVSVKVTRGNISNVVEGSGVLEANEQYDITALVSGDIVADYFSEGDMVTKDMVLYRIDSSSIEKNIEKSNNQLTNSKLSYDEAQKSLADLNCLSTLNGTITKMYVKVDDKVSNGTKICDVVNSDVMILRLPFLAAQTDSLYVGQSASVEIMGDSSTYSGKVSFISDGYQTNSYGVKIKNIEIEVSNPGGITTTDIATATINGVACSAPGNFEYSESGTIVAAVSGTVIKLNLNEGDKVKKDQIILNIENQSIENQATKAQLALNDATISVDNLRDDLEQYSIKSPIAGKIIQKNSKAGDKLGSGSGQNSTPMAVVADLSQFKLTINIDELEISSIKKGQKATVTVDALDGKTFEGTINNISIIGTSSNGVTTYPVEIIIPADEKAELIPGMNVDATIIVEEKRNILLLPASAIGRGNVVTKNGEEVQIEIGITDGRMVEIVSGLKEGDEVTFETVVNNRGNSTMPGMGGMGAIPSGGMGGGMPSGGMGARPSGSMGGGNRSGMSSAGGMMR